MIVQDLFTEIEIYLRMVWRYRGLQGKVHQAAPRRDHNEARP